MNIAIIGSGLTGSLASISLAGSDCRVDLYERFSDEDLINRERTYAITHSSRKILEKLNIWDKILPELISFQFLNLVDYQINRIVEFNTNDLPLSYRRTTSVGWIAEHSKIMASLLSIISQNDNINSIPTSVIPNTNNYDLIIAADGQNSITKKKLKTSYFSFNYDQVCITVKALLRGVKSNEAFEILSPDGPFALLPLGGDLFQIICSQSVIKASYNMQISKSLFLDYLATILPDGIQPDTIINEPQAYPIKFLLNHSFFSGKYVYLGETAHALHPVGGQGLNLCWRDVDCLSNLISMKAIRNRTYLLPSLYSVSRIIDVLFISIITDFLVRYSRSNISILYIPRKIIFTIIKKSSFIRKLILYIMTNGF